MACQRACSTGACGNGNRLPEDVYIFETVDAEGRPAEPGTLSQRVLVTNLSNHTHPLIRVKVTDEVCVIDRACPCGRARGCSMTHKIDSTTSSCTNAP